MGSIAQTEGGAGAKVCETQTASWVENVDSDLLQEQTQSICEELQRRGACTTLALARHLGFEKSSAINPLMCLLLEKNVVVRVSDIPPIWYLSPTFPVSPHLGSSQFSPSSQPSSPLNLGFPASVPRLSQSTPILPAPIPAPISAPGPVNSAPAAIEPSTATSAPAPSPTLFSTPASAIPSPALVATPTAPTISTPALEISAPIVTPPTVPPAPATAPTFTSTFASQISALTATPAPAPAPAPSPSPTPISTAALLTPAPTPTLTFLEHSVPVPVVESEEETEDEVEEEVAVGKTFPKTPLPALTFLEHLIPDTALEDKLSLATDNPLGIKPPVLVPAPTLEEHLSAIQTQKQEQHRSYRQRQARRRKKQRYFRGSSTSNRRPKTGDHLTELQMRILDELRVLGPTKTVDLSKRVGLVTCRDVNPSLFDLKRKNLVVRTRKTPVVWQLCEPVLLEAEPEGEKRSSDSDESW